MRIVYYTVVYTMKYYPLFIDIKDRKTLVVGGGAVAERKAKGLAKCGAAVTVIAPAATEALVSMEADGLIEILNRPYQRGDTAGYVLVIAATDSEELNMIIHQEALSQNILVNIVDQPEPGGFIAPAVIERGDLICALSSSGKSPFFIKQLKQYFEKKLYPELENELDILSHLRREVLSMPNLSEEEKSAEFTKRMQPEIDKILKKIKQQ